MQDYGRRSPIHSTTLDFRLIFFTGKTKLPYPTRKITVRLRLTGSSITATVDYRDVVGLGGGSDPPRIVTQVYQVYQKFLNVFTPLKTKMGTFYG